MFTVYVLYSVKYDKIYIGFTSNLIERMRSHNELGKGYTKRFRPWVIAFTEELEEKKQALNREKFLKSAIGRKFIWEYIRDRQ